MNEQNKKFNYTYTAPTEDERREIASIRKEYLPRENMKAKTKLGGLRALDKKVKTSPMVVASSFGVAGLLILGAGMAMVMQFGIFVWGILVGVFGLAVISVTYPIYRLVLGHNKQKYGKEILSLSDELLSDGELNE